MGEARSPREYVLRNRTFWDGRAAEYVERARLHWQSEPDWGIWGIPETDVRLLPEVSGLDGIELGCGTAYVSAWLTRRGARMTGIDNSSEQLATARALQTEFGLSFPLLHGDAENVPLPDSSFDIAISEYGASIWCDPYRWIPEAARLLRLGGQLIFLVNSSLVMLCIPDAPDGAAGDRLLRDQFGMHRVEWSDDDSVEFHISHGEWIRLLRTNGFEIENLVELQPSPDATSRYQFVPLDWARRWPSEEAWIARKRA